MSAARAACGGSGGKGRRGDGPADDADGPGELDPVRVEVGLGGGLADQGADRVMGEQVAVDLLADHVRALGPQHPAGSAQGGLELVVAGLVLPALVIALRQDRRRGLAPPGDWGDQADELAPAGRVPAGSARPDY